LPFSEEFYEKNYLSLQKQLFFTRIVVIGGFRF
jgi:hypothetical protein